MFDAPPPLMLVSDAARVGEERFLGAFEEAIGSGLRCLQVREPGWNGDQVRALIDLCRARIAAARPQEKFLLLVSRRVDLAFAFGLDGVHVGGGDTAAVARAREALGPGAVVGYSAHAVPEAVEAAARGASYVTYSPVYGAISKSHPLAPVGIGGLAEACNACPVPVYALGGVTPAHAAEVRRAGAAGAAMIGAILHAASPGRAVSEFLEEWARAPS